MSHDPTGPCGSLPVTTWNFQVTYCHHHMAWQFGLGVWMDTGTDVPTLIDSIEVPFGPFDSEADVRSYVVEALSAAIRTPSVPGTAR